MEKFDDTYLLERFSKTKEEFDSYYDDVLKEKMTVLEKERQEIIDLAKKTGMKLIIPVIAVIILYFIFDSILPYAIAALVFYGGFLFKDVQTKRKNLAQKIKEGVITELIHFMNKNFTYKPKHYLPSRYFTRANIFKLNPSRYTGDDLITGYVASKPDASNDLDETPPRTDISFSEVKADHVEHYKDKDGKTRKKVRTIFQGLFFKADFNKDFDGLTIVVPKQKGFKGFSFGKEKRNKLEEVELEDMDFMDKFTVRTTDQILARYILTPNFMNRLLNFSNRESNRDDETDVQQPTSVKEAFQMGLSNHHNEDTYSDTPYFSFRNGTMYFMLPTRKEHFEFNILVPLNKSLMYSYFRDINLALELVDELNLNLRIWNKQ